MVVQHNDQSGPTRPATLVSDFRRTDDTLAVRTSSRNGAAWFLVLWLIGWTVGCVALFGAVLNEPGIGMLAFALPFWASWLAVAAFLVWSWFGSEAVMIDRDRVLFVRKAIITLSQREIPFHEVRSIHTSRSKYQENDEYLWGIEIETIGKPIRIGFRLPAQERLWLIHQLQQFVGLPVNSPDPVPHLKAVADDIQDDQETGYRSEAGASQPLTLAQTLSEPPSDGRWLLTQQVTGPEFSRRGQFSLLAVAGLLFINCFWNGIVSVFILALFGLMPGDNGPPQGGEWWAMFVFLIPFEVIGLFMLWGLFRAIAEPFRRTVWKIQPHELLMENRWPLISRTRRWDRSDIHRLELRRQEEGANSQNPGTALRHAMDDSAFQLLFVSHGNTELGAITDVTEGEARWMAHWLLSTR